MRQTGPFSALRDLCAMLLVSLIVAVGSLTLAYLTPLDPIRASARASLGVLRDEGLYPREGAILGIDESHDLTVRDGFTDALMLDMASVRGATGLEGALATQRSEGGADPIEWLATSLAEDGPTPSVTPYARYWNGYLAFLKPLMALGLDYSALRLVTALVSGALAATWVFLSIRRRLAFSCVPAALSLSLGAAWVMATTLQYASVLIVCLVGLVIVAARPDVARSARKSFLLMGGLGIATAFLDLLTAPLLTLALPATTILIVRWDNEDAQRPIDSLRASLGLVAGWLLGYGLMWASKWLVASAILGADVVADALGMALMRTKTATDVGETISRLSGLASVTRRIAGNGYALGLITVSLAGYGAAILVRKRDVGSQGHAMPLWAAPGLALIALVCLAWCVILANHTYQHSFMTYRTLLGALCALWGWLALAYRLRSTSSRPAWRRSRS